LAGKNEEVVVATTAALATIEAAQATVAERLLESVEREIAEPDAGQVHIKVQACGIGQSDAPLVQGSWHGNAYLRVPGHEVVGIVDAISKVDRKQMFSKFICSIVLRLFRTLPTIAPRGANAKKTTDVARRRGGNREGRHVIVHLLLFFWGSSVLAFGQAPDAGALTADQPSQPAESLHSTIRNGHPDELKQELDAYAIELSRIPADPLLQPDPIAPIFRPIDKVTDLSIRSLHLNFHATYTFLNQYATTTPDGVRHNQTSGRLDFAGAWSVYDHETTAGSISLLIRSGTNIGISQQFNLSDRLGSRVYLNCLQGGGPQEPITVNILYWRQDLIKKRLSFYVGKIHPNEYVTLSMFNNDERTQFLNGTNDGNDAVASDGAYAGGGAVEFQASQHVFVHAVAVDTEGSQQANIKTLADRKYAEAVEGGWTSGSLGGKYRLYRAGVWRDDTKGRGSGHGGGFEFDHELFDGWTPFGRFAFGTRTGTGIKDEYAFGLAQVHPFGRRGDMFGASFAYSEPTAPAKHHESVFESFYRLRLTQSVDLGPDIEVSIHPTYAIKAYTTTLLGARMRIIL
jgi:porin